MKLQTFTADTANEAVAEIRRVLGPEAVVVHVRRVGGEGLSRLWQKSRIEVVACAPEPPPPVAAPPPPPQPVQPDISEAAHSLAELRRELAELKDRLVPSTPALADPVPPPIPLEIHHLAEPADDFCGDSGWLLEKVLLDTGVYPVHARRMMQAVISGIESSKPQDLQGEIQAAIPILARLWQERNQPQEVQTCSRHVFIGPPGSGKTNAICKWMTSQVLLQGKRARVWRLDGNIANSAEILSVYAEVLGVPVERVWEPERDRTSESPFDLDFIDLPGVEASDIQGLSNLAGLLATFAPAQVHLVLNAAYELPNLAAQLRAYSRIGTRDLILSHMDEELRWGKLWNLLLGTNCRIQFLSGGQNIPGDFLVADADRILSRQLVGIQ